MVVRGDAHIYVQTLLAANYGHESFYIQNPASNQLGLHDEMLILPTARCHSVLDQYRNLANAAGDNKALSPLRRVVHSALAETSLGESGPQLTGVRTTGQSQVSVDDGIAGRDKCWVARLATR